ncbi:hypothetical protein ABXS75_13600 [Roseburia hominis]
MMGKELMKKTILPMLLLAVWAWVAYHSVYLWNRPSCGRYGWWLVCLLVFIECASGYYLRISI